MIDYTPKETYFNGIKFRSRLEARWAALFDAIGISYQYEPEKFNLPDGDVYIPDFYLSNMHPGPGMYFEVKGKNPTQEEMDRCHHLESITNMPVVLFDGSGFDSGWQFVVAEPFRVGLVQCPFCGEFGVDNNIWPASEEDIEEHGWPRFPHHRCFPEYRLAERFDIDDCFMDFTPTREPIYNWAIHSPVLSLAISLAKSYRFESPEFLQEANGIKTGIREMMRNGIYASPQAIEAITRHATRLSLNPECPRYQESWFVAHDRNERLGISPCTCSSCVRKRGGQ